MSNLFQKFTNPSNRMKVRLVFLAIIALAVAATVVDTTSYYNKGVDYLANKVYSPLKRLEVKDKSYHLGLDLVGGTHLVYDANVSAMPDNLRDDAVEGARDVIERRVNVFGVSEPVVQTNKDLNGDYRIIVELAGIKDVQEAIQTIGATPILEFKEQVANPQLSDADKKKIEDTNKKAEKNANDVLGKLISGGNFEEMAKNYSEDTATKQNGGSLGWITEQTQPEIISIAKTLAVGQFSKTVTQTSEGFEIVKINEKREKADDKEIKVSHILICYAGAQNCESNLNKEDALKKINELKEQATPANFKDLAKANSTEPAAATTGGDLGWFAKGAMVPAFEDAAFALAKGSISNAIETPFGFHIIYKEDERNITEYNINHILFKTLTEQDLLGQYPEWKNTELTGKNLKTASVQFDPNDSSPLVSLEFDDEGAKLFEDITGRNVGKPVAIFLDNYPISIPNVEQKITGGKAIITGKFSFAEAKELATYLQAGALPVPITLSSQQTVGASLGNESVVKSLRAGLFGLLFVALFMILMYRFTGIISVISLLIYGALTLAIYKLWPVTLTLPGLAGFILSIGIAVDANILIFERLKEELNWGRPLKLALDNAFNRAWPSIRDGNISTLITCFVLAQFSTSMIKGFALTLGLGIIVSLFSAIIITRNLLSLVSGEWLGKRLWLIGRIKKTNL